MLYKNIKTGEMVRSEKPLKDPKLRLVVEDRKARDKQLAEAKALKEAKEKVENKEKEKGA